jgi:hypothetical protein
MRDHEHTSLTRRSFLETAGVFTGGLLLASTSARAQGPAPVAQCSSGGSRPYGPRFDPPALLDDLDDARKQNWSDGISNLFDQEVAGDSEGPTPQFFNPLKKPLAADQTTRTICWTAFPNAVKTTAPSDRVRWRKSDGTRDLQDEYCEWSVARNTDGKIVRVTFTCEGPEYWEFLAANDQQKTLDLYQKFVSPAVKLEDLYPGGTTYNPRNKWNSTTTDGAMHLVQRNNTLSAEIDIVAKATIRRKPSDHELTGEQELIACSGYGEATRNSDPHIGGQVNELARLGADITIANPVGLYFDGFYPTSDWATPDGSDPKDNWSIVRGPADMGVRAVYEVPSGKGFVVGDIKIKGQTIDFGAQITDFIKMKVTGLACRIGQINVPPKTTCPTARFQALARSMHTIVGRTPLFLDRRK